MNSLENINKRYPNDLYLTFFTKKIEKIVSALYLITDHFDRTEPLKWKLREKGTSILSDVIKLNNTLISNRLAIFSNISFKFFEIMSFLELAVTSKLLSEENFDIFKRELNLLLSLIENNNIKINDQLSPYIGGEHFKVKDKSLRPKEIRDVLKSLKDINEYKGQNIDKGQSPLNTKKSLDTGISNNEKKTDRRDSIIKILSKGQKLTIKDISKVIDNCSEKTIQRELLKMMKENILEKEGERRWSRYFTKKHKNLPIYQ